MYPGDKLGQAQQLGLVHTDMRALICLVKMADRSNKVQITSTCASCRVKPKIISFSTPSLPRYYVSLARLANMKHYLRLHCRCNSEALFTLSSLRLTDLGEGVAARRCLIVGGFGRLRRDMASVRPCRFLRNRGLALIDVTRRYAQSF